ncbi:MAG: hypothetical protein DCC67_18195 [Planctomycetota bacterium]|nr:MAG: hypothetical protein DCC67_18195 [Planctomycetota bacterium]
MGLLVQFLLRLVFGFAAAMAVVSPKQVTSGYFRNNLYVALGLCALGGLLSRGAAPAAFWWAVAGAAASYVGSVCWLYEKPAAGRAALVVLSLAALTGCLVERRAEVKRLDNEQFAERYDLDDVNRRAVGLAAAGLGVASVISSGLLIGTTLAAMLLGHWYLNSPTMHLEPLRRLIVAMGVAATLHAAVCAAGLVGELSIAAAASTQWTCFVVLRWGFGLAAVAILAWMAYETLKVPNTQSATGILYVGVIGVFVGETTSLLLSADAAFPL